MNEFKKTKLWIYQMRYKNTTNGHRDQTKRWKKKQIKAAEQTTWVIERHSICPSGFLLPGMMGVGRQGSEMGRGFFYAIVHAPSIDGNQKTKLNLHKDCVFIHPSIRRRMSSEWGLIKEKQLSVCLNMIPAELQTCRQASWLYTPTSQTLRTLRVAQWLCNCTVLTALCFTNPSFLIYTMTEPLPVSHCWGINRPSMFGYKEKYLACI